MQCPECKAEFDSSPGQPGTPKIKAVPAMVSPETCHVAEHLRTLADWLERGDFSTHNCTPDGAILLLFSKKCNKLTAPPVGFETDMMTMHGVLQAAITGLQRQFQTNKMVGR
jgi:hypothetical protein